jgi:hypothetical protein
MAESDGDSMSDTIQALILERLGDLGKKVDELTQSVTELKLAQRTAADRRRQMQGDLSCLADESKKFRERFEPYLARQLREEERVQTVADGTKVRVWSHIITSGLSVVAAAIAVYLFGDKK